MIPAPAAERFPAVPAAWYLFGPSRLLPRGPYSQNMLGRRFVAYRTSEGRPVVLDAHCAHLGADLGRGCVTGDSLRCPFHGWVFAPDGVCTHVPGAPQPPAFARQQTFPTVERHGHLFFFHGATPTHPLPFFLDEAPEDFVAGRRFAFRANCPWYMLAANGFDMAHMQVVHDRTLESTPVVDCPDAQARRVRYRTRITGHSIFDRLLRTFVGNRVEISITNWGGAMTLVSGDFGRARSYIVIATQPTDDGATWVEVLVVARRSRGVAAWFAPLALEVRRWFTRGFMQDDIDRIGGMRYRPQAFVEGDATMVEFLNWVVTLGHTPGSNGVCDRHGGAIPSAAPLDIAYVPAGQPSAWTVAATAPESLKENRA